jgi:drug/metabolite transporter (DMT)-like permease
MKKGTAGAYVSVILAMTFWGFTFVLFKVAVESFRPVSIVTLRLFVSIFFLFGFALAFKRLVRIKKKDQPWFILMALFEPFFYFLCEANGLTRVSATTAAVIISTIPLFTLIASRYFFREKLTKLNMAGMVISFAGVLLVILKKGGGLAADPLGILLMFGAVLCAVGYTLVVRKLVDDYNPITITAYMSLYGLLMFLPIFLIREIPHIDPSAISTSSLLSVLYLGVVGSGICFILVTIGIRELGAARANIFANIVPVVAAIVSFLLLNEVMPATKIMGIAVTILGLFLSQVSSLGPKFPVKKGFRHPPYS